VIIFRYLAREVFVAMLAVSSVLLLVFMSARFVKYLAQAASGEMDGSILFAVTFYRLPGFLELILPLGLFLGILLAYGRLYVESEMIVLSACGVGKKRLAAYTMGPALTVMALVAWTSLYLTPMGWAKFNELWDNPDNFSGLGTVVAGRFQRSESGDSVTYTEQLNDDRTRMNGVFVASYSGQDKQASTVVVLSESGTVFTDPTTKNRFIELQNGYRYEGNPGQQSFEVTRFERYGQLIKERKEKVRILKSDAKSTQELWTAEGLEDKAALQWRLSIPLTVPIVALIALALSETNHRRGRYIKLLPAILLYLMYVVILSAARRAIESGRLAPEPGMWSVHLLFFAVALLLLLGPGLKQRLRYSLISARRARQGGGHAHT
jgi:lipopolysaccharide export system permease protein